MSAALGERGGGAWVCHIFGDSGGPVICGSICQHTWHVCVGETDRQRMSERARERGCVRERES